MKGSYYISVFLLLAGLFISACHRQELPTATKQVFCLDSEEIINGVHHTVDEAAEAVFGFICHQRPEILMKIHDREVSLCPRCLAMHLAFLISYLIFGISGIKLVCLNKQIIHTLIFFCLLAMGVEWMLSQYSIIKSTTVSRLLTGALFGLGMALFIRKYFFLNLKDKTRERISTRSTRKTLLIILILCVFMVLLQPNRWLMVTLVLLVSVLFNFLLLVNLIMRRMHTLFTLKIQNYETEKEKEME